VVASVRPVTDHGTIREASLDDIPAASVVRAAALPDIIVTAEGMLRRGAARLLKSHSLHLAAQAGASLAITGNEDRNAPMLAVNESLGYQPYSRRVDWEWVRSDA
jgi:hypothetical protein